MQYIEVPLPNSGLENMEMDERRIRYDKASFEILKDKLQMQSWMTWRL